MAACQHALPQAMGRGYVNHNQRDDDEWNYKDRHRYLDGNAFGRALRSGNHDSRRTKGKRRKAAFEGRTRQTSFRARLFADGFVVPTTMDSEPRWNEQR